MSHPLDIVGRHICWGSTWTLLLIHGFFPLPKILKPLVQAFFCSLCLFWALGRILHLLFLPMCSKSWCVTVGSFQYDIYQSIPLSRLLCLGFLLVLLRANCWLVSTSACAGTHFFVLWYIHPFNNFFRRSMCFLSGSFFIPASNKKQDSIPPPPKKKSFCQQNSKYDFIFYISFNLQCFKILKIDVVIENFCFEKETTHV